MSQANILKKRLHGAKKSGVRVVFGVFLAVKSPFPKLTILLYYSLCNMASFANFQNFVFLEYYYIFFSAVFCMQQLQVGSRVLDQIMSPYVCISSTNDFLRFVSCTQSEKFGDND